MKFKTYSKKTLAMILALVTIFSIPMIAGFPVLSNLSTFADAAQASTPRTKSDASARLQTLISRLEGKYFTTNGAICRSNKANACFNENVIKATWLKNTMGLVPDSANLMPTHYTNGSGGYITSRAWSCAGFANFCLWYIYASRSSDDVFPYRVYAGSFTRADLDKSGIWPGDVFRVGNSHSMVYISHNSSGVKVLDSNFASSPDNKVRVHTINFGSWRSGQVMAVTRGKNFTNKQSECWLDLNCYLDGSYRGDISGIATADVYINGSRVKNDTTDFYAKYPYGTTYKITDIRVKSGYTYNGNSTYSGTLNSDVNINLSFSKKGSGNYFTTDFRVKSGAYTNAYASYDCSSYVGRVYTNDVIRIQRVYNNGVAMLVCPWSGGVNKTVYCKVSELKFKATKYIQAYSGVNGSTCGRVYPDDIVTICEIYSSGWMKAICPWTGGVNKTIYLKCSSIY